MNNRDRDVPVDLDAITNELNRIANQRPIDEPDHEYVNYAPPAIRNPEPEPLPDYVVPRADVPPVGALSAEALVRDFEKTAKDIEGMATEMTAAASQCAVDLAELATRFKAMAEAVRLAVADVKETAAAYRDEAKTVFVRIENTVLMTQEMRQLSASMRDRIRSPDDAAVATTLPANKLDVRDDGQS